MWDSSTLRPSANKTCTPAQRALSAELRITEGAQNCPFLMWMTRPVRAAATMRSVCRHRKAGIWMMSATSAIASACDASWMSVMIGSPSVSFTTFNTLPRQSGSAHETHWLQKVANYEQEEGACSCGQHTLLMECMNTALINNFAV